MSNEGKQVSVHYRGTLDNGEQFDSSYDRGKPLEFTCMAGMMIPGFDRAVRDMEVGETKTVRLEPEDAYGPHREEGIQSIAIKDMPGSENMEVGQQVTLYDPTGRPVQTKVVDKTDTDITFDLNHPLAGEALTFEIKLLSVVD